VGTDEVAMQKSVGNQTESLETLAKKSCRPCEGGMAPLDSNRARDLLRDLPGWTLDSTGKEISKEFLMKDFSAAVELINKIAQQAEKEDHHPDIHLTGYRKLKLVLSTHSIGGLSDNDFILAARIETLPKSLKS